MKKLIGLAAMALAACGGGEQATENTGPRGVTADTIVIGSHTDLSGGLAIWGVPMTNGQRMRYAEANAAGGIHGRQIELIVEDTQYQMPLAIKATNKLLNVDDIFQEGAGRDAACRRQRSHGPTWGRGRLRVQRA